MLLSFTIAPHCLDATRFIYLLQSALSFRMGKDVAPFDMLLRSLGPVQS